ncbi:GntR family transcriptional regulator [Maritalea sp.]|uniref:GntR family transcriptional regulator n=1 Tax=Maritalea sp. TaxID=2003361 RepID=UPI003EF1956C
MVVPVVNVGTEIAQSDLIVHLRSALARPGVRYELLAEALRQAIDHDILTSGEFLLAERELSDRLGVSRVTIRRAFKPLLDDGQLIQKRGLGTYVPRNRPQSLEKSLKFLNGFSEDIRNRGMEPSSQLVFKGLVAPISEVCEALGVEPHTRVSCFRRIRFADGSIMAYELAYFPLEAIDAEAVGEDESLYARLDASGFRPVKARQSIKATNCDKELAGYLGVETGSAILDMERTSYDRDGKPIEFTHSYYRGDRYVYSTEVGDETKI